jgi:hypothetical protein
MSTLYSLPSGLSHTPLAWDAAVVRVAEYLRTTEECKEHWHRFSAIGTAIELARKCPEIDDGILSEALDRAIAECDAITEYVNGD